MGGELPVGFQSKFFESGPPEHPSKDVAVCALRASQEPATVPLASRVGLTPSANLLSEQGGSLPFGEDVAGPATKRVMPP